MDTRRGEVTGRGGLTGTFALDERLGVLEVLCGTALLEAGERCLLERGVRAETLRVRPAIAPLARTRVVGSGLKEDRGKGWEGRERTGHSRSRSPLGRCR